MTGLLADGALSRGHTNREIERFGAQLVHGHAVQIGAGVDVHVTGKQLVAARCGHNLDRGHKGEIGDGAVAGDEVDEVRTGSDLPGDALQIVAGAVHKVVAGVRHLSHYSR